MAHKTLPHDLPHRAFETAADFEAFLEKEHATAPGIYLKMAKKCSGIPSITSTEAVEIALCFGWIDGRANTIDDNWWTLRFTPRRAKSIWSQKNVATITRLMEGGRMRPAGLAAVSAAKADGRWDRAYAGPATMKVPEDFTTALAGNTSAKAYFESLKKSDRYSVLMKVEHGALSTRPKRIEALVELLATGRWESTSSASKNRPAKAVRKGGLSKSSSSKLKAASARRTVKEASNTATSTAKETVRPRRAGLRSRPEPGAQ